MHSAFHGWADMPVIPMVIIMTPVGAGPPDPALVQVPENARSCVRLFAGSGCKQTGP